MSAGEAAGRRPGPRPGCSAAAREHRAGARPAQSPAPAGTARRAAPAAGWPGPPTSIRPRARPLRLPGPLQAEGASAPRDAKPRGREVGREEQGGGRTGALRLCGAGDAGPPGVPGGPARLTATCPSRRALTGAVMARSSAWETEPRRSKKLQRKEIQGQGSHPLASLQLEEPRSN